jgi:16S rRNA processing protein RimM
MTEEKQWARWGTIGRPHGVRGEVRAFPDGDGEPFAIEKGTTVRLLLEHDEITRTVTSFRGGGKFRILALEGVESREDAETLRHAGLLLPMELLEALETEEEFYVNQLLGATVISEDGKALGHVLAIEDYGAGEILVYGHGSDRKLLPFAEPWIIEIDLEEERLIVDPNWIEE